MLSKPARTAAVFMLLSMLAMLCAQAVELDEYAVKAAYLFKLANYVRWPFKETPKSFVFAIYGEQPTSETLKPFAASKIQGVPVSVIRIERLEQVPTCHLLFVSGDTEVDRERLRAVVKKYQKQPVLIVADGRSSIEDGAAIFLTRVDDNIKFELSVPAAATAGLSFDARLQKIAHNVHRVVIAKE